MSGPMINVLCQPWEASIPVFGQGPTGYSIHASYEAHAAYTKKRQAKVSRDNRNEHPYGNPYWIRVDSNQCPPLSAEDGSSFKVVDFYREMPQPLYPQPMAA